jgi:hypothetical protein
MNLYFIIQLISIFCNFEACATVTTCHVTRRGGELGHFVRVQHTTHLLDGPLPDLNIYGHLLEAKIQVGDVIAIPCHEGMYMISVLIVLVCIEN